MIKEQRLQVYRSAVDGLVESLEAVVRLSRLDEKEPKPEPLVTSAAKLLDRLGTASRLSTSRFAGSPNEISKVDAIRGVLKDLDAAYLAYRQQLGPNQGSASAQSLDDAGAALETKIASMASATAAWR